MKKFVTLIAALGVSMGGLVMASAAPAQAATYINAKLPTNTGASNLMDLCSVECIQNPGSSMAVHGKTPAGVQLSWPQYNPGASAQGDTTGTMNWFSPQAGNYKAAVRYSNSSMTNSVGYLKAVDGGYQITKNWAEASWIAVPDTSADLGTFTVLGNEVPPNTDPETPAVTFGEFMGSLTLLRNGEPVAPSGKLALCQVNCLNSSNLIVNGSTGSQGYAAYSAIASDGDFYVTNVPRNSYRVAVNIPGFGNGYLRSKPNGSFDVVSSIDAAAIFNINGSVSRLLDVEQGLNLPEPDATYDVIARSVSIPGEPEFFSSFRYTIFHSTANTKVNVKVIGCGGKVVYETNRSQAGKYTFDVAPRAKEMGTNWKLVTSISEPGRATSVSTLNKFTPNWDFSCSGIDSRPSVKVKKWSTKAGKYTTAKRGKTLKVTATKAETGAKVTYAWKINGKVVDRDRSMRVKKAYVGQTVRLKVTVKKHGKRTRTKTISYGRAKR